jgi:hypothetical protein
VVVDAEVLAGLVEVHQLIRLRIRVSCCGFLKMARTVPVYRHWMTPAVSMRKMDRRTPVSGDAIP